MTDKKTQTKKTKKPTEKLDFDLKTIELDILEIKNVIGILTNSVHKITQNENEFKLKLSKVADRLGL